MSKQEIKGYVIHAPIPFKKERWIQIHTFSQQPYEAWLHFIGYHVEPLDQSRVIQHWHDRGYRIADATLTVEIKDDE